MGPIFHRKVSAGKPARRLRKLTFFPPSALRFPHGSGREQIQTGPEVLRHTKEILVACPTDRYLVAVQPGVHAADVGRSMPHLRRAFDDSRIRGRFDVAEVVGGVHHAEIVEYIKSACAKKNEAATVDEILLPSPSSQHRASTLSNNGELQTVSPAFIAQLLTPSRRYSCPRP